MLIDECLVTTSHNMLEMAFSIVHVKSKFPGKLMRNDKYRLGFRPGFIMIYQIVPITP